MENGNLMQNQTKKQKDAVIAREKTTDKGISQVIPCGSDQSTRTASIQVVKAGELVQRINVHCGCGQTTTVICKYD